MTNPLLKAVGATAAAVTLALFAYGAQAQQKAPDKGKAAPKVAACNTIKAQAGCEARKADCNWVAESKDAKTGKVKTKAYCRANPETPAKAPPTKK